MKTEPNDKAYPISATVVKLITEGYGFPDEYLGFTKRELMAIEFTKATTIGIISASGTDAHGWTFQEFAKAGLAQADALINELNK